MFKSNIHIWRRDSSHKLGTNPNSSLLLRNFRCENPVIMFSLAGAFARILRQWPPFASQVIEKSYSLNWVRQKNFFGFLPQDFSSSQCEYMANKWQLRKFECTINRNEKFANVVSSEEPILLLMVSIIHSD